MESELMEACAMYADSAVVVIRATEMECMGIHAVLSADTTPLRLELHAPPLPHSEDDEGEDDEPSIPSVVVARVANDYSSSDDDSEDAQNEDEESASESDDDEEEVEPEKAKIAKKNRNPLSAEIFFGPDNKITGRVRAVVAFDVDGFTTLRLDSFIELMLPKSGDEVPHILTGAAMRRLLSTFDKTGVEAGNGGESTTFRIHITLSPVVAPSPSARSPAPILTVNLVTAVDKLRPERKTFRMSRVHSEFFRAQLYGDFVEHGKETVDIKMFTTSEFRLVCIALMQGVRIDSASSALALLAHTDFLQAPWLHERTAKALAELPWPDSEPDKERWLLAADKYNACDLADKLILTMSKSQAARFLAKHFETLSKSAGHLLAQRSANQMKTFTVAFPAGRVTVLLRIDENDDDEVDECGRRKRQKDNEVTLSALPREAYKWRRFPKDLDLPLTGYGLKLPGIVFPTGGSAMDLGSEWKLCTYRGHDHKGWLYLSREADPVVDTILGDVVAGEHVFEGRINHEHFCMGRVM